MGMGKIYSSLTRPLRIFNVANRAEKIISREKPIPAPHHASVAKQKKLADQVNPNFMESHYRRDMQLDQRLKDVFVTSTTNEQETIIKELKQLPLNRTSDTEYDFYDPVMVSAGKCSLRHIFTFLSQHKENPAIHNSENIAAEYKIDKKIVDDILKHFKLYVSVVPDKPDIPDDKPAEIDEITPEAIKINEEYQKKKKTNKKELTKTKK